MSIWVFHHPCPTLMHNARWYMHRILPRDPLICNLNSPLATRRYTKSKKCSHDPLFHYTNYRLFQQNFSVEHLKLRPLRKNHSAVMAKVWMFPRRTVSVEIFVKTSKSLIIKAYSQKSRNVNRNFKTVKVCILIHW